MGSCGRRAEPVRFGLHAEKFFRKFPKKLKIGAGNVRRSDKGRRQIAGVPRIFGT